MKTMIKIVVTAMLLCLLMPVGVANALSDGEYFTIEDQQGVVLCRIGAEVSVDDEYISGDNQLYRVVSIDKGARLAKAEHVGEEPAEDVATTLPMFASIAAAAQQQKQLVAIYCTHSDESYLPTDGISSSENRGGIFDVAESFAKSLNDRGIETIVDESLHHPHDAGAYRRSRTTAAQLVKQRPAVLIDIHRDGIPAPEEYEGKVDGEATSLVRLLVGRANPNSASNRAFAKQLKASADSIHPGLIKDIFIGKGNYNQELMPHSILMEFGTYTLSKDMAIKATDLMADVIQASVFGKTTTQEETNQENTTKGSVAKTTKAAEKTATAEQQGAKQPVVKSSKGSGSGIAWVIGIFVVGLVVVGLIMGGTKGFGGRMSRTASEMTGGLVGKKPKDGDKLS